MADKDKGEWAQTADEGVVPDELGGPDAPDPELGNAVTGRTTGSEEPATEEGVDRAAGDAADATTDGGSEPPDRRGARPQGHRRRRPRAATRGTSRR